MRGRVMALEALVRRRGRQLERNAIRLREQELALRRLITSAPVAGPDGTVDLSSRLAGVVPAHASLAVPAEPVMMPAAVVDEVLLVVASDGLSHGRVDHLLDVVRGGVAIKGQ